MLTSLPLNSCPQNSNLTTSRKFHYIIIAYLIFYSLKQSFYSFSCLLTLLKYSTPIKNIIIWEFPHLSIKSVSPVSVYSLFLLRAIPPLVLCIPSVLDFSRIFQLSLSSLCSSSILLLM